MRCAKISIGLESKCIRESPSARDVSNCGMCVCVVCELRAVCKWCSCLYAVVCSVCVCVGMW